MAGSAGGQRSGGRGGCLANGPDLIISDVLMPEMNGYELCQVLKTNPATSHIPILLLTAKAALESLIEGFSVGADDYVTKPFQVDELRGRVRNRLRQQQRIRQHHRTQLLGEGHLPAASPSPQDEFMNRIYTVLKARLDDTTFGVEPLADAMGLSRMHLNRKVKTMTGMTPNELIRIVRLNRAAELLLTGLSIAEVADQVGFDTAAYFSKVFKEQYHQNAFRLRGKAPPGTGLSRPVPVPGLPRRTRLVGPLTRANVGIFLSFYGVFATGAVIWPRPCDFAGGMLQIL